MAEAKLNSVENLSLRLGLGECEILPAAVQLKLQLSLEAATIHLISLIRTEFARGTITDKYWLDKGELPFMDAFPKFFLSQDFVDLAQTFEVRFASQLSDLAAATPTNSDFIIVEYVKGTLLITGTDETVIFRSSALLGDRFFTQIDYTAGWTATDDGFGNLYDQTLVPEWLKEVAILLAMDIHKTGQPCDTDDKNCPCSHNEMVARYIRFIPSATKPLV